MKQKVLFNILTRSSGRPVGFNKCYNSIQLQTYKNFSHYVSVENSSDNTYLEDKDVIIVKVEKENKVLNLPPLNGNKYAPYNLYCNKLLEEVEKGWILFLDDDDNLLHNKVLEELANYVAKYDEDTLFIWQMRYPNGKLVPNKELIKKKAIVINNIGSPCFLFHSKFKNSVQWDSYKRADFRFINQLQHHISKKVFLNNIYIQINNFGDFGNRNDLSNHKMPLIYYKNFFWYFLPKYHFKVFGIYIFHKRTYLSILKKIKLKLFKIFQNG